MPDQFGSLAKALTRAGEFWAAKAGAAARAAARARSAKRRISVGLANRLTVAADGRDVAPALGSVAGRVEHHRDLVASLQDRRPPAAPVELDGRPHLDAPLDRP